MMTPEEAYRYSLLRSWCGGVLAASVVWLLLFLLFVAA